MSQKKMILHARPQHEWNIDEHNVYKCKLMTYCTAWLYQIKSNRKISWFNELVVQHVYWASDLQSLSGVSIYVNFHVEWRVHCVGMSAGGRVFEWLFLTRSHLSAQLRHCSDQCVVLQLKFLSFIIHIFQILKFNWIKNYILINLIPLGRLILYIVFVKP